jgi:hypothetical protein
MEDALKKMKILKKGYYTLFENEYGRRILVLDGGEWYAWINGDFGPTLIYSEAKGTPRLDYKIIMQGRYFLENMEADPLMPHLYLQNDDVYMEIVLPQGMPSIVDTSKLMIISDNTYPKEYVESLENLNEAVVQRTNVEKGSDIY